MGRRGTLTVQAGLISCLYAERLYPAPPRSYWHQGPAHPSPGPAWIPSILAQQSICLILCSPTYLGTDAGFCSHWPIQCPFSLHVYGFDLEPHPSPATSHPSSASCCSSSHFQILLPPSQPWPRHLFLMRDMWLWLLLLKSCL